MVKIKKGKNKKYNKEKKVRDKKQGKGKGHNFVIGYWLSGFDTQCRSRLRH